MWLYDFWGAAIWNVLERTKPEGSKDMRICINYRKSTLKRIKNAFFMKYLIKHALPTEVV